MKISICQFNKVISYAMFKCKHNYDDVIQKVNILMSQLCCIKFCLSSKCHHNNECMLDCRFVCFSQLVNGLRDDF